MTNIKHLLDGTDSSMKNIVKIVIYMRDVSQFEEMNRIYRRYFREGEEPARVTVQAASPIAGIDIEIEVTALTNE